MADKLCSVPGCDRVEQLRRGLCNMHRQRLKIKGEVGQAESLLGQDDITYGGAHYRVMIARGRATDHICPCGRPALHWAYQGGDPNERCDLDHGYAFSPDPVFYEPRCGHCHRVLDGGYGESHGRAKLTETQAREILVSPLTHAHLAQQFGVSRSAIKHIKTRRLWKHL